MCRPKGTPRAGAPDPAVNGNSPHACTVVAWYSVTAWRWAARPPPATGHPRAGATWLRWLLVRLLVWVIVLFRRCRLAGWPRSPGPGRRAGDGAESWTGRPETRRRRRPPPAPRGW